MVVKDHLVSTIRHQLQVAKIDPFTQPEAVEAEIERALERAQEAAFRHHSAPTPQLRGRDIRDEIVGYGPLQALLDDPEVEEIWVNAPASVFIAKGGRTELTSIIMSHDQLAQIVERMLQASGRRLDLSSPFVDALLPGGHRLHAVIPPITGHNWSVNIRKHIARSARLSDLVNLGSIPPEAAELLDAVVRAGMNVLVSGATQAGKTTMLRALAGSIPAAERVITCEEVFELELAHRDCVALQTRPANLEGGGEVTLRRLVKESLRMRPDRLIIGEVREAESLDMLIALNAGVPGMATLHANSAADALAKLTTLPLLAGPNVSPAFVTPTVAHAIDVVIHCTRNQNGARYVNEIAYVPGRVEANIVVSQQLFHHDGSCLRPVAVGSDIASRLAQRGLHWEVA